MGNAGLLGLMLPADLGGAALGPRAFAAVTATLAESDASVAMVYLMHICATATIAAARPGAGIAQTLKDIAGGQHLSTLAFSESGSRSHFWAPVSRARRNGAGVYITAKKSWVTSAGCAHSYVVSTLAPEGTGPTDSTLYRDSREFARAFNSGRLGWVGVAGKRVRSDDTRWMRGPFGAPAHR